MKKVIIIGANQNGIFAAYRFLKLGFDVSVYEAKDEKDVSYNWTDDIDPNVFKEIGIEMPDTSCYFPKKSWAFVNPAETVVLSLAGSQETDISIWRRPLNDYLKSLLPKDFKINYNTKVDKLIIDNDTVKGVVVNGENIEADLVIDASGVMSNFRATLPSSFNIQANPDDNEVFVVTRTFYEHNPGVEMPKETNKAYLLHLGEKGISWCITTDDEVDILIGRVGALPDKSKVEGLKDLQKDNPILSDKKIKGGDVCVIPVRYPISRMVANGYALVGDSAFMTIPMMGSGVAAGLLAVSMLADTIEKNDSTTIDNLWNYQVAFVKRHLTFYGIDVLKRWLLQTDAKDIDFLFEKGIINQEIMAGGTGGEMKLGLGAILGIVWKGKSKLGLLIKLAKQLPKMDKVGKLADTIPETFDEAKAKEWQDNLDNFYKNL
ncbi:MAG: hypothetical protein K5765_04640 [Clostridia bacterium]|nr:hypothetical protein [Clostridia bacterium]